MREIRTLELNKSDATTCWVINQAKTLRVCEGILWLTIEGDAEDRWLVAGDSIELAAGITVWLDSQTLDTRLTLASAPAEAKRVFWPFAGMPIRTPRNRYRLL